VKRALWPLAVCGGIVAGAWVGYAAGARLARPASPPEIADLARRVEALEQPRCLAIETVERFSLDVYSTPNLGRARLPKPEAKVATKETP
jgi:hypothetical protein